MLQRLRTASIFLTLLLSVAVFLSGVAEANNAPTTVGTMPDQALTPNGTAITVTLSDYFSDTDGDTLIYTATSDHTGIATVSVSGTTLTLTPGGIDGTATITVTATDPDAETATQTFSVTANRANKAPTAIGTIPDQALAAQGIAVTVTLSNYFSDVDGDTLTYTATSSDTTVATVSVSTATLTITPLVVGTATITVTATDPDAETATQTFSVSVSTANNPPAFSDPATAVDYLENGTDSIASFPAVDPDSDAITYSVVGTEGDGHLFQFSSSEPPELSFKTSPDYERPSDSDANNTYLVTIKATDTGGLSDTHTVTVTVTDIPLPPKMSDPALGLPAVGAMEVKWIAVSSTYLVDGYKINYHITGNAGDGQIADVPDNTKTSFTLIGLQDDTYYQVKVLAYNSDGEGPWSNISTRKTLPDPDDDDNDNDFLPADTVPLLSSELAASLAESVTMDTVIFNELLNASVDAHDWIELRNVTDTDINLNDWTLTLVTSESQQALTLPAGAILPANSVILLRNTEAAETDAALITEGLILPQAPFTLILESPSGYADVAGNSFLGDATAENLAPLTVDQAWYRLKPALIGYRAEAWMSSATADGTPGRREVIVGDVNADGIVNILDLVLVASQLGETGDTPADMNGDGTVSVPDLVAIATAWNDVAAAPSGNTASAQQVQAWLTLARQGVTSSVQTALPDGFSYERGIQTLEQLVQALAPKTTALLANYPNPFNPETWIPYQLAKPADVTVRIYAANGAVVRTLALGHQAAGRYQRRSQAAYWDGKNQLGESVASGVYFYTLTAGDFTATRKMLIQK